jgi:hypothetical protein
VRYLVTAILLKGKGAALARAIADGTLGAGSIAGDEYERNMATARQLPDGRVQWVETCFCDPPLDEERPYWETYFSLDSVKDAHARHRCQHETGQKRWACGECDCTEKLERVLARRGRAFTPGVPNDVA